MTIWRPVEIAVGLFIIIASAAFLFLAFKVSGLVNFNDNKSYYLQADFANVGDLKVRAPVTIAGVRIGEVAGIDLDPDSFIARITMKIHQGSTHIPRYETSARILTEGILGSNYISITPGFTESEDQGEDAAYLRDGDVIQHTQPALILENIIGELFFNIES